MLYKLLSVFQNTVSLPDSLKTNLSESIVSRGGSTVKRFLTLGLYPVIIIVYWTIGRAHGRKLVQFHCKISSTNYSNSIILLIPRASIKLTSFFFFPPASFK